MDAVQQPQPYRTPLLEKKFCSTGYLWTKGGVSLSSPRELPLLMRRLPTPIPFSFLSVVSPQAEDGQDAVSEPTQEEDDDDDDDDDDAVQQPRKPNSSTSTSTSSNTQSSSESSSSSGGEVAMEWFCDGWQPRSSRGSATTAATAGPVYWCCCSDCHRDGKAHHSRSSPTPSRRTPVAGSMMKGRGSNMSRRGCTKSEERSSAAPPQAGA